MGAVGSGSWVPGGLHFPFNLSKIVYKKIQISFRTFIVKWDFSKILGFLDDNAKKIQPIAYKQI